MRILGIESSCDETSAAVVEDGTRVLSNVIASSVDLHAQYGGVVPEIAARSHIESINAVIDKSFAESNLTWDEIDAIAVTKGPGLLGSLLIGVLAARTLAIVKNKPLYGVNHVEAHVYASFLAENSPDFPAIALIVSGGHSQLVYFKNHFSYKLLGQTYDDAIGEAFDKAAKIIGLPYPGGPNIAKTSELGDPFAYQLPIAKVDGEYNFSFSGLKTAVLRLAQNQAGGDFRMPSTEIPALLNDKQRYDIAAVFQRVAVETVLTKTVKACQKYQPKSVIVAGGVAANQELRHQIASAISVKTIFPPIVLCTDNAAMVASLGCFKAMDKIEPDDPYSLAADPNLRM